MDGVPLTCDALLVVAGLVHLPHEELQPDDGVDDNNKEHKQGDVQQGYHGLDDGVQNHLETCNGKADSVHPPLLGAHAVCRDPLPADGSRIPVSGKETEAPGYTVRVTPRGSWIQVGLTPNLPRSHLQTEGQEDAVLLRAFQLGKMETVLETDGGDVGFVPLNCALRSGQTGHFGLHLLPQ